MDENIIVEAEAQEEGGAMGAWGGAKYMKVRTESQCLLAPEIQNLSKVFVYDVRPLYPNKRLKFGNFWAYFTM